MREAEFKGIMEAVSQALADQLGLSFPPSRWEELQRGIAAACPDLGFADTNDCLASLGNMHWTRNHIDVLARHLTVGETYFFREPQTYAFIEQHIVPALLRSRQNGQRLLRFWSAGCASGEEPYSLAILLHRCIPDIANWAITILATDINPGALRRAADGIYSAWSFRGATGQIREKYFQALNARQWQVRPEIRELVTFGQLNLADPAYPALVTNTTAMDLILCRNVLMYFAPDKAREVVARFSRCLVAGGWLNLSPTDLAYAADPPFRRVPEAGATFLQKRLAPAPVAKTAPAETWGGSCPARQKPGVERRAKDSAGSAKPRLIQAEEEYARGRYSEAADLAESYLREHPTDGAGMELLARSLANQGKLDQAKSWCERALAVNSLGASTHLLLATVLEELADHQGAAASLRKALYLDPNSVMARYALGNLLLHTGDSASAAREFRAAVAALENLRPNNPVPAAEGLNAARMRQILEEAVEACLEIPVGR